MLDWLREIKVFLMEFIRLDGRAERQAQRSCNVCLQGIPHYRCRDCLGGVLLCQSCIVKIHVYNPFHYVEVCFILRRMLSLLIAYPIKVLEWCVL